MLAVRGGAAVIAALAAYVGVVVVNRMRFRQMSRIWRTLAVPAVKPPPSRDSGAMQESLGMWRDLPILQRPNKIRFLQSHVAAEPTAPLVVTGPEGAGKTGIIKQVLLNRPNTLYLDLRQHPVSSGQELQRSVVTAAGYLLPPSELVARVVFRGGAAGKSQRSDLARGLGTVASVLEAMRDAGAGRGPTPILVIDELQHFSLPHQSALHQLLLGHAPPPTGIAGSEKGEGDKAGGGKGAAGGAAPPGNSLSSDAQVRELLDWCMYLTSSKLAHVILAASPDVGDALDRASASFAARREKLYFDYPRRRSMRAFLKQDMNQHLALRAAMLAEGGGRRGTPPPQDTTLRGRLRRVLSGQPLVMPQYDAWTPPVVEGEGGSRPLTVQPLADWEVEGLIDVVGGNLKDMAAVCAAVAEGGSWQEVAQRLVADAVEKVESTGERLLSGGVVLGEPVGPAPPSAPGSRAGQVAGAQGSWVTTYSLEGAMRYLRFFDMMGTLSLSGRKYIPRQDLVNTVFGDASPEIDVYVDAGLLMCFNLTSATKLFGKTGASTPPPSPAWEGAETGTPPTPTDTVNSVGVRGRFVSAATPRLRVAFEVVLADPRIQAQLRRVQDRVHLHRLRTREQRLLEQQKFLSKQEGVQAFLSAVGKAEAAGSGGEDIPCPARTDQPLPADLLSATRSQLAESVQELLRVERELDEVWSELRGVSKRLARGIVEAPVGPSPAS